MSQEKKPSRQERRRIEKNKQKEKESEESLLVLLEKIDQERQDLIEENPKSVIIPYYIIKKYLMIFNYQENLKLINCENIKKTLKNAALVILEELELEKEELVDRIAQDDFEIVISNAEKSLPAINKVEELKTIETVLGKDIATKISLQDDLIKKVKDIHLFIDIDENNADKEKILALVENIIEFDFILWENNTDALLFFLRKMTNILAETSKSKKDHDYKKMMHAHYYTFHKKFSFYVKDTTPNDRKGYILSMLTYIILFHREYYQTLPDKTKRLLKNKMAEASKILPNTLNIYYHFYLVALDHFFQFDVYNADEKLAALQEINTNLLQILPANQASKIDILPFMINLSLFFLLKSSAGKLKIPLPNHNFFDTLALFECFQIIVTFNLHSISITSEVFFKILSESFSRNPDKVKYQKGNIDEFLKWLLEFHQAVNINHQDKYFIKCMELVLQQLKISILNILNLSRESFSKTFNDHLDLLSGIQKHISAIKKACGEEFTDKLTQHYALIRKFEPVYKFMTMSSFSAINEEEMLNLFETLKDIEPTKEFKASYLVLNMYEKYQEVLRSENHFSPGFLEKIKSYIQLFENSLQNCYTETPISSEQVWIMAFHAVIAGPDFFKTCSSIQKAELRRMLLVLVEQYPTLMNTFLYFNFSVINYFLDEDFTDRVSLQKDIFLSLEAIKKNKGNENLKYFSPDRIIALLQTLEKENKIESTLYSDLPPLERLEAVLKFYLDSQATIKITENKRKLIQSKLHKISADLLRYNITVSKPTEDLNQLILILGKTIDAFSKKPKVKQYKQIVQNIFDLIKECEQCLQIEKQLLTQESQTVIERLEAILKNNSSEKASKPEIDKKESKAKLDTKVSNKLIAKLREVNQTTEKIYQENKAKQFIFYKLIKDYLEICSGHIEELDEKVEFKKIVNSYAYNLIKYLNKEVQFILEIFPCREGQWGNILREAEILLGIITSQEEEIKSLFGEIILNEIKTHQRLIASLQKVEKFLLNSESDLESALNLADSLQEIDFSFFGYNANIICSYYQKINFFLNLARESGNNGAYKKLLASYQTFQQQLQSYCQKLTLDKNQKESVLLMLFYIVIFDQKSYKIISSEIKEILHSVITEMKEKFPSVFYFYLDFYITALEFLEKFNQYNLLEKSGHSKILIDKLNQITENNAKNASLLNYFITDTMPFLFKRFGEKMGILKRAIIPLELLEKDKPEKILADLKDLLESIKPFPKELKNPNPGTVVAASFVTKVNPTTRNNNPQILTNEKTLNFGS